MAHILGIVPKSKLLSAYYYGWAERPVSHCNPKIDTQHDIEQAA